MTSISIRRCLLNGKETNIHIEDHLITEIGTAQEADRIINARNKIVLPSLVNTHTHSAMSLLRGFADDMELQPWLEEKIWPLEKKATPKHVYWGARLACLEMIKTGTTAFNDMYFHVDEVAKAVDDSGIRAVIGYGFVDLGDEEKREVEIAETEKFVKKVKDMNNPRVKPSVAPHAVYTVSDEGLDWCMHYARKKGLLLHIHLSETEKENMDCLEQREDTPVCHLDKIGFLGHDVIAAHGVWMDDEEVGICAKKGVKISHCPTSNMKLGVGRAMPYMDMRKAGMEPSLGTDGCASNNNLDMFENMKFAALLQKFRGHPTALPHSEAFSMATEWGANALHMNIGKIEVGKEADVILLDAKRPEMMPLHDIGSNIVYSANGTVVTHTICRGQLLMDDGKVEGEDIVLKRVAKAAADLTSED